MSTRELTRAGVLARVEAGTLSLGSAAVVMDLSYRQTKRLYRRYRAEGAKGLKHRSAGRRSNAARDDQERAHILALVREKYSGTIDERFGPTLAAEHLASEAGAHVHHDTLRRWMLVAGLWSRARKRSPYRRRRERKAHFGELVQLDGSFHAWYEDRGERRCLITMVDDATSRTAGHFSAEETIWAAARVLRTWIEQHGIPHALYTDWKNVYVRAPTEAERAVGTVPRTQFGRMCAALDIQIIAASSPQAKGRIERSHGTHQDRLVKKLRSRGIADDVEANAFLAETYWPTHNARFTQLPAAPEDFHRQCLSARVLDRIFRLEDARTVGQDWVVRYHNRWFQLRPQSRYTPARSTVMVAEWPDGRIAIEYRGRLVAWTEIAPGLTGPPRPVARPQPRAVQPAGRWHPSPDHPWRQSIEHALLKKELTEAKKTNPKGTFLSS